MPAARTFHIRPVLAGQPLGAALRRLLPQQAPPELKRLVRERQIQLNGNVVLDEQKRLKAGDVVKVFEHPQAAPASEQDVRVRHLDEHLVVVEKPAGVTTLRQGDERAPGRRRDRMATLEEMLQRVVARKLQSAQGQSHAPAPAPRGPRQQRGAKHPLARRTGPPPPPRGGAEHRGGPMTFRPPQVRPVHRLDRDTSGLLVFALSAAAEQALTRTFKEHAVERKYLAVVHGHPPEQSIETYFVRDRGDGLRGSTPRGKDDSEAQRAVTHVRPLERIGDYCLVECRLETGRTHQIRIHLAEIGHTLCGEKTYTRPAPGAPPIPDRSGAPRQALHSAELHLDHPMTGNPLRFRSPLPPDLAQWLDRLRRG